MYIGQIFYIQMEYPSAKYGRANRVSYNSLLFLTPWVLRGFPSLLESKYMNQSTRKSSLLLQYLIQGEFQDFMNLNFK